MLKRTFGTTSDIGQRIRCWKMAFKNSILNPDFIQALTAPKSFGLIPENDPTNPGFDVTFDATNDAKGRDCEPHVVLKVDPRRNPLDDDHDLP